MSLKSSAHVVLLLYPSVGVFCCFASPYEAGSSTVSTKCGVPNRDSSWLQSAEELDIAGNQRSTLTDDTSLNKQTSGAARLGLEPGTSHGAKLPGGTASECWQVLVVALHADHTEDFCSGTIIGSRTILTSAVGVDVEGDSPVVKFTVITGIEAVSAKLSIGNASSVTGCAKKYDVSDIIRHPDFDKETKDNDIAVIILSEPIDFVKYSACTCRLCLSRDTPGFGDKCVVSGYGSDPPPPIVNVAIVLPLTYSQQTVVPYTYDGTCDFEVSLDGRKTNTSLFICARNAAGQTPCSGDAGDPLFCFSSRHQVQYLAGLSTAQVDCGSVLGSIFAKVALYVDWIIVSGLPGDVSLLN